MKYLIKPGVYSHECHQYSEDIDDRTFYMNLLSSVTIGDKMEANNIIIGELVDNPQTLSGDIWCGATNIRHISALTLDFDDGFSIKEFHNKFSKYTYYGYTSYNHFKAKAEGKSDRFRIIMPLTRPIPMHYWGESWIKKPLIQLFKHCDTTCFDKGHWQILPVAKSLDKFSSWYNFGDTFNIDLLKTQMLEEKAIHDARERKKAYDRANRTFEEDYDRDSHIEAFVDKYIIPEIEKASINYRGNSNNVNKQIGNIFGRMMSHPKIDFLPSEAAEILLDYASDPKTIKDIKGWENFFERN